MKSKSGTNATIRLRPRTHRTLKQIAGATGESMQQALERAVEERHRRLYLRGLAADYAAIRSDHKASRELDVELAEWDRTNSDGLEEI